MNQEIIRNTKAEIDRVVKERKIMNISQTDLARFIGCRQQTLSRFENGKNDSLSIYMGYISMMYAKENENVEV